MIYFIIGLLIWHALSLVALLVLGNLVGEERRRLKGLAYALALVNVGYVVTYALILIDTNLVGYTISNWLTQLLRQGR